MNISEGVPKERSFCTRSNKAPVFRGLSKGEPGHCWCLQHLKVTGGRALLGAVAGRDAQMTLLTCSCYFEL